MSPEMKAMHLLGDEMDEIDLGVFQAQVAGDATTQARLLCARALLWRKYSGMLEAAGRDGHGAVLAAQRDENTAAELTGGTR